MEAKKIGFFARIKKSIINFEEYEKFIEEPLKKAFGFFFKLIAMFSLLITIALTYTVNTNVQKIKTAIETEFPNFKVENNTLSIDGQDIFEYYFEDYDLQLIMNVSGIENVPNENEKCIKMLEDRIIIKYGGYVEEIRYNNIGDISNQTIIDFFGTNEWKTLYFNVCLVMLLLNFILYSIIILLDVVALSILGLIINTLIRTKFKYQDIVKISIYAMTLPILLYLLYIVANTLFGTTIKFFQIAYSAISYIYLITVMLMMKADAIKNTQELQRVLEEQKKVKEELEREKQEEKERQKEKEEKDKKKRRGKRKRPRQSSTRPPTRQRIKRRHGLLNVNVKIETCRGGPCVRLKNRKEEIHERQTKKQRQNILYNISNYCCKLYNDMLYDNNEQQK